MKYTDFKPQAKVKIDKFMYDVVDAVVKNTERVVKKGFLDFPKPPIDTGNLRRNIKGTVISQDAFKTVGEVRASTPLVIGNGKDKGGKEIEYAFFVEYGTIRMQPRPFMRNGVKKAELQNKKIINTLMNRK